jgi:hypothetical protein
MSISKTSLTGAIALIFLSISQNSKGQIDTIRLKDKRLHTAWLKTGLNQYLIYYQNPKENKSVRFWFWMRDIKTDHMNGSQVFVIKQHWYGSDTSTYRYIHSVNNGSDFAPIYHEEISNGKTSAYTWKPDNIVGADSVKANIQKDFSLKFSEPNFNWNLDIETLEMLPLANNKSFAINFYDAGQDPPKYYLYTVAGSETLQTLDNKRTECWKVTTNGTSGEFSYIETYWISKDSHEFLKEESSYNGMFAYKIKLMESATDLLSRFAH